MEYKPRCSKNIPVQYMYCSLSNKEDAHYPVLELSRHAHGEQQVGGVGQDDGQGDDQVKREGQHVHQVEYKTFIMDVKNLILVWESKEFEGGGGRGLRRIIGTGEFRWGEESEPRAC